VADSIHTALTPHTTHHTPHTQPTARPHSAAVEKDSVTSSHLEITLTKGVVVGAVPGLRSVWQALPGGGRSSLPEPSRWAAIWPRSVTPYTSRFSLKLSFPFRNSHISWCGRSLHVGFQTTRRRQC